MATSDDAEFEKLLGALEDWHLDSVQAQSFDGSGHGEPGHVVFQGQHYIGAERRRKEWKRANELERAQILHDLENEHYGLSHSPSQKAGDATGLRANTLEWKTAVATAEGSLRAVARQFGVSHETVRTLRMTIRSTP